MSNPLYYGASSVSDSGGVVSSSSSGHGKDMFIYEIPLSHRKLLCDHLDELNVWNQLATIMSLKPSDIQGIRRQQTLGNSPTDELLRIWGGQYNHTTTELFIVLKKLKLYEDMRILKDFVQRKYHVLIPNSQPILSELLEKDASMAVVDNNNHSHKILNCATSSGVSNSNNYDNTSDNSNSASEHSFANRNIKEPEREEEQLLSNCLSERNVKEYASSILEINYFELTEATNNWNENFVLGKGGFGTVYRGYWKHTDVAIKQIHYRGPNGRENIKVQLQQSLNELKYLNSCRHDNVLPLYGYSIKGDAPCLVYQLMKGGSLEQRLKSKLLPPLTWQERINICQGTARGVNYLHTFRSKPLIHGDIKPANVLLDQCLHPKIGDFGLAREGPNAVNSAVEVSKVFGTKPYLPPEFINSRKLSTQVDTYSFGVVLLETFTGQRVYERNRSHPLLTRYMLEKCSAPDARIEEFIDKNMMFQNANEMEICKIIIRLGIECIAESPQNRPEMEHVLKTISSYYNQNTNFNN